MLAQERRLELLEMVRVRGFASLPELAEAFSVSESTIRRDVDVLEQQGAASRIHGGVLYTGTSPKLPHLCGLDAVNYLVVDQGIADAWRTTLESARVRVLVAGEDKASSSDRR